MKNLHQSLVTNPDIRTIVRPAQYFIRSAGMPPMDLESIELEGLAGETRYDVLRVIPDGEVSLALAYKKKIGAIASFDEHDSGDIWEAVQISGNKSRKSLRVCSSLYYPKIFADTVVSQAKMPDTAVRQMIIRPEEVTKGIAYSASAKVQATYGLFKQALGLRWSEELNCFIRDFKANSWV